MAWGPELTPSLGWSPSTSAANLAHQLNTGNRRLEKADSLYLLQSAGSGLKSLDHCHHSMLVGSSCMQGSSRSLPAIGCLLPAARLVTR